jgi:GH15 family glucan-1,4-alpha-glucosidase
MLDKTKGGHFTISPTKGLHLTTKQNYLPSSNVLQTRFLNDEGVLNVIDFFPRPKEDSALKSRTARLGTAKASAAAEGLWHDPKRWLVRRVECIRGEIDVDVEVLPVSLASHSFVFILV